jgi:hypothetical protein
MKKLEKFTGYTQIERALAEKVDKLIDEVEALKRVCEMQTVPDIVLPADDKPEYNFEKFAQGAREYAEKNDTHRTVTLRIPKGMRIGEAILTAWEESDTEEENDDVWTFLDQWLDTTEDTDLQKALDEVKGESNE